MSALQLFTLALVAALIGVSHSQVYGRFPSRSLSGLTLPATFYPEPCCYGGDDLNALLLLAKALENNSMVNGNNVNSNDIINKLLNALIYATTGPCGAGGAGGAGGSGGAGGTGGAGGSGGSPSKPSPSGKNPPLLDVSLLSAENLLDLMLAGQDVLRLDLGKGGGALTNLVGDLI